MMTIVRSIIFTISVSCIIHGCSKNKPDEIIDATNPNRSNETKSTSYVGAEGGIISLSDGASITIPQSALKSPTYIQIQLTEEPSTPLPEGYESISAVYQLEPQLLRFASPVSLNIPYRSEAKERSCYSFLRLSGSSWEAVEGGTYQNGMASIRILLLGIYRAVRHICVGVSDSGLADAGADAGGKDTCFPITCESEDKNCGEIDDGCGEVIDCGSCPDSYICNDDNTCVCVPISTSCPYDCGTIDDGCGGTIACGDGCAEGEVCEDHNCICIPSETKCDQECGTMDDGCGGTVDCGTCPKNYICNDDNTCECLPVATLCPYDCGTIDDGCGGTVACGDGCEEGEICEDHNCICIPSATECDLECGAIDDGCGRTVECGACDEDEICEGNVCQTCIPSIASCDLECGSLDDGCGNPIDCGGPCSDDRQCIDNVCVCKPVVTRCEYECGTIPDGCGSENICGDGCQEDEVCMGNVCTFCVPGAQHGDVWNGDLVFEDYMDDISVYAGVVCITGDLTIDYPTTMETLSGRGFESLQSIGGNLTIDVALLKDLSGFESLVSIGKNAKISVISMKDLSGLESLVSVGGNLSINMLSNSIESLSGLDSLVSIGGDLLLFPSNSSSNIGSFTGLDSLASIGGSLSVANQLNLTSLSGLESLLYVGGSVQFNHNSNLPQCMIDDLADRLGVPCHCIGNNEDYGCDCEPSIITCDYECGTFDDGCGGTVECDTCDEDEICIDNTCQTCIPSVTSCDLECGTIDDGCGRPVPCGEGCPEYDTCKDNFCIACVPSVTSCDLECGTISDGCGGLVSCGSGCNRNQECVDNICVCVPTVTECPLDFCGDIDDGCGNMISCRDGCECSIAYRDEDGDGYGMGLRSYEFCGEIPPGYSKVPGDCCDNGGNLSIASQIFPGQSEYFYDPAGICGIEWDYNCDGVHTLYAYYMEDYPDIGYVVEGSTFQYRDCDHTVDYECYRPRCFECGYTTKTSPVTAACGVRFSTSGACRPWGAGGVMTEGCIDFDVVYVGCR